MLKHLKTLPLTILLTILIWMYAEAQFTSTRDDVHLAIRMASPSPDLALRVLDSHGVPIDAMANLTVTLQGPKSQIDRIFEQAQGQSPDEDFGSLTYTPPGARLQANTGSADRQSNAFSTVSMLNSLHYFRSRNVIVIAASPATIHLDVDTVEHLPKTPDFRSSVILDRVTLTPEQVMVNVPSRLLQQIGADNITVAAIPQMGPGSRDMAALAADSDQTIPIRFTVDYPATRDERITVTPVQGSAAIHVPKRQGITETIPDVPVWVAGPPALLARYSLDLRPKTVRITLAGSPTAIQALRQRLASGTPAADIHVFLDLTADDHPTATSLTRRLRYALPEGLTLQQAPADLEFRLLERAPATQPASAK